MAEIINLRQARKQRNRATREAEAADNRRRFGRTKAEKADDAARTADAERAARTLDAKRLERDDPPENGNDTTA